jgi:hypothetical protein
VTSQVVNLCGACGLAVHPDNDVVQGERIFRVGLNQKKEPILRPGKVEYFHEGCWSLARQDYKEIDRGPRHDVASRS